MIQNESGVDSLGRTGDYPYRLPADVAANPQDYYNPYDDMLTTLKEQNVFLKRLTEFSETERTKRKTQVFLSTTPFSNTVEFKSTEIVLSATGACSIVLTLGTTTLYTFIFSQADSKRFPFIWICGRGQDISISTTAGGVTITGYLIADPN